MNKKWIQDIMCQQFVNGTFINPIRLIMVTYLMNNANFTKTSKKSTLEYIYRTLIDNQEIAKRNPNVIVRNINNYGLFDISGCLDDALNDWCADAKNNILSYDNNWIYLDIDPEDETIRKNSIQVLQMLYKKYFKISLLEPVVIKEADVENDTDIMIFGKGVFKRRVLEDIQYCPLCEEIHQNNLYAVHILPDRYCNSLQEKVDKANGILLCLDHAEAYINKEFYFNENGVVCESKTKLVNKKMHMSFAILNKDRRKYLKRYYNIRRKEREKDF